MIAALLVSAATAAPVARTQCADYVGITETFTPTNATAAIPVSVWRGVPYAAPPLGSLRWMPPRPYSNCTPGMPVTVAAFAPMCVQNRPFNGSQSEDCLFLNVYAPSVVTEPLPVLVFLHGGDLTMGSASWHNATAAVALFTAGAPTTGPVIIVVPSYRLNALGFLSTPDMCTVSNGAACGNFGLLDQRAVFAWVRDHIYAFGGDASRVTISGQSSGGTSVLAHLTTTASRGLFSGVISLSGSPNITMGATQKLAQDAPFVATLGCASPSTPRERVACMRALDGTLVARSTPEGWDLPQADDFPTPAYAHGWNNAGIPYVDGDAMQLPLLESLAAGTVDVPVILSSMAVEMAFRTARNVSDLTDAQWHALLVSSFNTSINASWHGAGDVLYSAYAPFSAASPQLAYDMLLTDNEVRPGK